MGAGVRFKLGEHLWECTCGELSMMGQKCRKCGKTYADILIAKAKAEKPEQPKKRKSKYREPTRQGEFITSYLVKKPEK